MKAINYNQFKAGPKGPAFTYPHHSWRKRLLVILMCSLIGLSISSSAASEDQPDEAIDSNAAVSETARPPDTARHPRDKTYIKRTWGVEVIFVRQASAGYMLEFRYKVLDALKAAPLFVRATKPVLIDAETGARMIVPTPPTTGALRNSNPPVEGKTYWMFFANPGKAVKPGNRVSIEIGDFRVDEIIVE